MAIDTGASKPDASRARPRPTARRIVIGELCRLVRMLVVPGSGADGQPQPLRARCGRVIARTRALWNKLFEPQRERVWLARVLRHAPLLVSSLAFLVFFCGLLLGWADGLGGWGQFVFVLALLGIGALASRSLWLTISRHNRYGSFYVLAAVAICVVILASYSMWDCFAGRVPVFAQLHRALLLFAGEIAPESCVRVPLGLQVAELGSVIVLFATVYAVVNEITSGPIARWRASFSRRVILITGLSDETLPVIRSLAEDPDHSLIVVVEPNPDHPLIHQARRYGAQVIKGEISTRARDEKWLRGMCTSWGKHVSLRRAYLLAADEQANLEAAEVIRDTLADLGPRYRDEQRAPTRLIVRIDRYRPARHYAAQQVESWRVTDPLSDDTGGSTRSTADLRSGPRVFISTLGKTQIMAHTLAEQIAVRGEARHVFVVGETDLAEAFLDEWRFQRESAKLLLTQLGDAQTPWRDALSKRATLPEPTRCDAIPDAAELKQSGASGERVSVVVAEELSETERSRLEGLAPDLEGLPVRVFLPTEGVRGLARYPMLGFLHPFGATLGGAAVDRDQAAPAKSRSPLQGVPQDSWFRAAKLASDSFTIASASSMWHNMVATDRDSNFRATWSLLTWLSELGYTWSPARPAGYRRPSDDLLGVLVPLEHRAWMTFKYDTGWCGADERNGKLLLNEQLHRLEELTPELRDKAISNTLGSLRGLLHTLEVLDFYPVAPKQPHDRWWRFQRVGTVKLLRTLEAPEEWTDGNGNRLTGQPGDLLIEGTKPATGIRTIKADRFESSYRHDSADLYKRIGSVRARIAVPGEAVDSLEGTQTAGEDSWVVQDDTGASWIVTSQALREGYVVEGPAGSAS